MIADRPTKRRRTDTADPAPDLLHRTQLTERYRPSSDLFVLQFLAVVVAVGGILQDAPAVVIGAMLLAPVMRPVLSLSAAIVVGRAADAARLVVWITIIVVASIGLAYGMGRAVPGVSLTDELLGRTSPDLRDLAVTVAAGTAGAYSMTRAERSSALPGVAVAVALVPPMAATGLAAAAGRGSLARGAARLLGTNLAAIVLMGIATFTVTGVISRTHLRTHAAAIGGSFLIFAGVLAASAIPLAGRSLDALDSARTQATIELEVREWLGATATRVDMVELDAGRVTVQLVGPTSPPATEPLATALGAALGRAVDLDVRWVQEFSGVQENGGEPSAPLDAGSVAFLVDLWLTTETAEPRLLVDRLAVLDRRVEIDLVGTDSPPDTTPLLDQLEAQFGFRPELALDWTRADADEMTTTAETVEQTLRSHFASVDPSAELVAALVRGDEVSAIIASPFGRPDEVRAQAALDEVVIGLTLRLLVIEAGAVESPTERTEEPPDPSLLADQLRDGAPPEPAPRQVIEQWTAAAEAFNAGRPAELTRLVGPDELTQVVRVHVVIDGPVPDDQADGAGFGFVLVEERSGGVLRLRRVVVTTGENQRITVTPLEPGAIDIRDPRTVADTFLSSLDSGDGVRARSLAANPGDVADSDGLEPVDFGPTRFIPDPETGRRLASVPVLNRIRDGEQSVLRCDEVRLVPLGATDAWLVLEVRPGPRASLEFGSSKYGQAC